MTSEQSAEDLLIKARSGELSEEEARRFQITVGASRELAVLYRAGVALDEQAELLPGDEARMSALVAGALDELDAELSRGAPRPVRRRSNAWFFASSAAFGEESSKRTRPVSPVSANTPVTEASAARFGDAACGSSTERYVAATSAAVTRVPSWNRASFRSSKTQVRSSGEIRKTLVPVWHPVQAAPASRVRPS